MHEFDLEIDAFGNPSGKLYSKISHITCQAVNSGRVSTGSSPFFINAGDTDDTITIEGEDGNAEIYIGKSALEGNLSHVSNLRVGPHWGGADKF